MKIKSANLRKPSASLLAVNMRGSILIIALWSLCLLAAFAVILGSIVRQKLVLVQRLDERAKLRLVAEAGIRKAIMQVKKDGVTAYAALKDDWSNDPIAFREIAVGNDGEFSVSYNSQVSSGEAATKWGLVDEERKINLNRAGLGVLTRLFEIILNCDKTAAQELAAAIIDWRDSDSLLSIPSGSAEDAYYTNLPYPYKAKNADLEVLDELFLIKGMTNDVFAKIRNYVTIYGDGKVNINTASKPVLIALGLDDAAADKILTFRCGEDGVEGTGDDNVFDSPENIIPYLGKLVHLSDLEKTQIKTVAEAYLSVNSDDFMADSIARLNNRKNTGELICVFNRSGAILYWQGS